MSAYEAVVLEEMRRRLREYAHRAVGCRNGKDYAELSLRIRLTTAHTLRLDHTRIAEELATQLSRDLPGAALAQIHYDVDPGTNPPDVSVSIEPPPCRGSKPAGAREARVAPGWLVLALSYMDYGQLFHLAPVAGWIPLGRGVRSTPTHVAVRIADNVNAVPKGPLLYVRRWEARLQLLRGDIAQEYTILLDNVVLRAGTIRDFVDEGTITFALDRREATHLRYRIHQEN